MDYSSTNLEFWSAILQFGIIAIVLLLGNAIRRQIPFIRRLLLPTAVFAGFVVLILRTTGLVVINAEFLEMITYHGLAVGFIAMSLRSNGQKQEDLQRGTRIKSGAFIVSTYLVQGLIGIVSILLLRFTVLEDLFPAAGLLLPMGFGQGPGQANNIGSSYEALGFTGGRSFGLSIAAAGYISACVVGVIVLNVLAKRGKIVRKDYEVVSGSVTVDEFQSKDEIPVSESIDKFSIQVAMVLVIYLATYLVTDGLVALIGVIAPGAASMVSSIVWGFNFIIASVLALLFGMFLKALRKRNIMRHNYCNNYLMNRISGLAFDMMIIGGIASIDISDIRDLLLPFILLVVFGTVGTLLYIWFMSKKLYRGYEVQGFLSMYGMLTGTISSGILLLRETDPDFTTPASDNLLIGTSFAILFGAPVLILISLAAKSLSWTFIVGGLIAVYLLGLLLFMLLFGRKSNKV